jgi:hypothetical protein
MARRFDVRAASHGAAGIGLIVLFGSAGVILLFELNMRKAIPIAFLLVSFSYACAMLFFGFYCSSDDK